MKRLPDITAESFQLLLHSLQRVGRSGTAEEAAQKFVELLYDHFRESLVLLRLFMTVPYSELPHSDRQFVDRRAGESDADDLTQVVFLKISGALATFRGESSLSTWIYRIATNVACDHARVSGGRDYAGIESVEDLPDPAQEAIDRAYIRQEMHTCIQGMIAQLPEQYRTPLLLSDLEDIPNAQIAEILGLNLDTVKIRLHRARTRLRAAMECGCTFYRNEGNELMCDRKPEK